MDDFGLLPKDFAFRPQGKNSPMISASNRPPSSSATVTDVFGGPPKSPSAMADLDYDAIFKNSTSTNNDEVKNKATSSKLPVHDDDIFDGLSGLKSKSMSSSASNTFPSTTKSPPKWNQKNSHFDDLMRNPIRSQKVEPTKQNRSNRSFDQSTSPPSSSQMADEIWLNVSEIPLFTKPTRAPPPSRPPPSIPKSERVSLSSNSKKVGNNLSPKYPQSPMLAEEMDSVLAMKEAMDRAEAKFRHAKEVREREQHAKASRNIQERAAVGAKEQAAASRMNQQKNDIEFESFFNASYRSSSAPRGAHMASTGGVIVSSNMQKTSVTTSVVDDLSSIFGGGQFQEVEGENEERRKTRLEREQRTQERTAKVLAEKNQRDLQSQREQEERNRIGGSLDSEIKRWAAGKEGNLRALLSTLQYVLWPESGWQAVSLTDLMTGANVKKAYRKATLCIHPDKVQQKGATLQQKYVAEKVFDILKEAWNKFNSEELF